MKINLTPLRVLAGIMAVISVLPGIAYSWGYVGHEVVCEIAFQELTDTARQSVRNLLQSDSSPTFARSCNWADESEQKEKRRPDHFINVPRYYYEIRSGQCRLGDQCLFSAIREDTNTLAYSSDHEEKAEALKYLGHWVGDLHQPLHVSYADDWGGNKIKESGSSCEFNLHAVWDSCIIREKLGTNARDIARRLREEITNSQREEWSDSTAVDWADESYDIARREELGYCERDGNVCWYDDGNRRFRDGEQEKRVVVDQAYLDRHAGVVKERLQQAGVRLGALLNQVFDPPEYD